MSVYRIISYALVITLHHSTPRCKVHCVLNFTKYLRHLKKGPSMKLLYSVG